jgi:hypothetical protein
MKTIVEHISCPDYQFDELDLNKVSKCIDSALVDRFAGKNVVLRGIQSEKHSSSKEDLIQKILETGSDRDNSDNSNQVKVNDVHIDLFGFACKIKGSITLPVLEGFHKWKPKSLERPQLRVDIWMIYDAEQLDNVEYNHGLYGVKAKDGYVFKKPNNQQKALMGMIVID